MAINGAKNITDIDFEDIRSNLQTYLEAQDRFKDYDFNGSGLSILLDTLAYNTHYSTFYTNMVANEMFLDSAVKRESVVSHAKQIGYTPHSHKSAEARVNVSLSSAGADTVIIPTRTQFNAEISGIDYTFYNMVPITIDASGSAPYVSDIFSIYEGSFSNVAYVVSSTSQGKYIIPSETVDTDRMTVRVTASSTDSTGSETVWNKCTDITGVTAGSQVYFLDETTSGFYEIKFGDNIVGKKLEDGNLIIIEYLNTSGSGANGIGRLDSSASRTFTTTISNSSTITVSSAAGGSSNESVESIRQNAPLFYQTQDRAVTKNDYKALTLAEYGNADDVLVFGGEDYDPPQYGKVFVSVKPTSGGILTDDQKQDILRDVYASKSVVGVIPEIIDPEYTYLKFRAKFDYDSTLTTRTQQDLQTIIFVYLDLYADTNLSKFGKNLYINQLEGLCRALDPSLLYVDVDVEIEKRIAPTLNKKQNYVINYQNPVENTTHSSMSGTSDVTSPVQSSSFAYKKNDGTIFLAAIDCDMEGDLRIYETVNNERTTVFDEIGKIDFEMGKITIKDFSPLSATKDGTIRFVVTPKEDVIKTTNNNIITYDGTVDRPVTVERVDSGSISTTPSTTNTSSDSSTNSGY